MSGGMLHSNGNWASAVLERPASACGQCASEPARERLPSMPMTDHTLAAERLHFAWDNSLPPVLEIEPGDTVTIDTWDANAHAFSPTSTAADTLKPRKFPGHALTGPIAVHGARPGDTLVVD